MHKKLYIGIPIVILVTISVGVSTSDEYLKQLLYNLTSMSTLGFLITFVIDQVKQAISFTYDKKRIAYDLSMNSKFSYNVHSEYFKFSKEYVEKVYVITDNMLRDGGNKKCLEYSNELYLLRRANSIVIPEAVHTELKRFEYTLRVLGAGYGYQQNISGCKEKNEQRLKSIDKTHKLFLQLMDENNKDEDRKIKNKEEIIGYIRGTVGINRINDLKHEVLES